ncbi:hxxPF-repeated domain protein [Rhodococcus sp. MTM3W5.2]|nr:hxxPF-repeated domain protein [Rhodococcus sp. MTM3W5.2]
MWFAQQLTPTVPITIAQYIELHGDLDFEVLHQAAKTAAHEFQSPYLRVIEVDGEPFQLVDESIGLPLGFVDFRGEDDPAAAAEEWMHRDYATPVNLSTDRLFDITVLQVGDRDYLWYSRIHHVALDGYGGATVMNRIAALYTAAVEGGDAGPAKCSPLTDLYELDVKYRTSSRFESDRKFWADRIRGIEEGSSLVAEVAPAAARSRLASAPLTEDAVRLLEDSDLRRGATSAAVVIAGFACYLSQMTGTEDVLVNIPVSARTTSVLHRSGGMLVNVVPLRLSVRPGDTVAELVQRVNLELMGALRHQRCSLEDIRRDAGRSGERSLHAPMVNVMLFSQQVTLGSVVGENRIMTSGPVDDLLVNIYQSGSPPSTVIDFRGNPNLYEDDDLRSRHHAFVEMLEGFVAADPDTRLMEIHARSFRMAGRKHKAASLLAHWSRVLSGIPEVLTLPADRPRPIVLSDRRRRVEFDIGADLQERLISLTRDRSSSVFTAVHAALGVLLSRLGDTDDVAIGTPVTVHAATVDGTVEPSDNTVVLRTRVDGGDSFGKLLHEACLGELSAFNHAEQSFERLVETVCPVRSTAYAPLVQVLLEVRNARRPHLELPGLTVEYADADGVAGEVDLCLSIAERHDADGALAGMSAAFTYATDLFDPGTIERFATRFVRILDAATADPSIAVGDIEILDPDERDALAPVFGARRRRRGRCRSCSPTPRTSTPIRRRSCSRT